MLWKRKKVQPLAEWEREQLEYYRARCRELEAKLKRATYTASMGHHHVGKYSLAGHHCPYRSAVQGARDRFLRIIETLK